MQQKPRTQSTHGAKAIALDQDSIMARYRLFLFTSIIITAAFALGLHVIFTR